MIVDFDPDKFAIHIVLDGCRLDPEFGVLDLRKL